MLERILEFLTRAHATSLDEFAASYPDPVFVIERYEASEEVTTFDTSSPRPGLPQGPGSEVMVAFIRKRPGANSFSSMITVGRTSNNDIQLEAEGVSKFHAYVVVAPEGSLLVDAQSTNGTFLNERQLNPEREKAQLNSGDLVRLGELKARYFTSEGFYDYLINFTTNAAD